MFDINSKIIPKNSGVYIMKDKNSKVIYVGKAKNLEKRVKSYFISYDSKEIKTKELVKHIHDIEFIIVKNEVESLILENNLIKKYMPKYNILLKDKKTYPYIEITKEEIPKISKTRKIKDNNSYYFGPYPNINIKSAIETLIKVFMIRDCNINVYKDNKRACLKYDLKLCNAPCVYKDNETINTYKENSKMLIDFLNQKSDTVLKNLFKKMNEYSKELEFEKAIVERERIDILKKLLENQYIDQKKDVNEDVFLFEIKNGKIFVFVLKIRNGIVNDKDTFEIDYIKDFHDNIYQELFVKYYDNKYIPKTIILDIKYYTDNNINHKEDKKILEEWVKISKNKNINIVFPKIKSKSLELLEIAKLNLYNHIDEYYNKKVRIYDGLKKLKDTLNLKRFPKRIDCYDISNIQGTNPVAAMTVAINGNLQNSLYRHFNIRIKNTPDDFLMLKEAVTRRYSKVEETEIPDLILIDGGKGQLSSVYDVLKHFEILKNTDIISIAKKEELIFKANESEPYIFSRNDEALKILQRLRDEAHRFGITHHRKLRSKRILTNNIENISGISLTTKKKLLDKFGTFRALSMATLNELLEVVSEKTAKKIYEYFRSVDES